MLMASWYLMSAINSKPLFLFFKIWMAWDAAKLGNFKYNLWRLGCANVKPSGQLT